MENGSVHDLSVYFKESLLNLSYFIYHPLSYNMTLVIIMYIYIGISFNKIIFNKLQSHISLKCYLRLQISYFIQISFEIAS